MVLTPVWVAGAVWSLRSAAARPFRPVAIACVTVIALQFVLGGKAYYPGAAFTFLLAAGCVPLERRLARRRAGRARRAAGRPPDHARVLAGAAMVAGAVLAAPVALPVLPARALHAVPLQKINYDLAEAIAWPKLVALVAREYRRPAGRAAARGPRSWPATTARRERSTATVPGTACRRSTAAPTTSGSGARRPPPTPRPSR